MTDRIAILGGGVMGETLLSAILASGRQAPDLVLSERRPERADELREKYGVGIAGNSAAVTGAGLVLLVVKPQDVPELLAEIAPSVHPDATIVSVVAGIRIDTIAAPLPDGVGVIRVMPNTPALVGEGMFGVSAGPGVDAARQAEVVALLEAAGKVVVVGEELQDAVTAVSGSGPAYVFYLAEAMMAGGVAAGLEEAVARTLTVQTLVGSAALLAGTTESPEELRRRVTSPNGTTAAAITAFDERDVQGSLIAGVTAAAARSAELSRPGPEQ